MALKCWQFQLLYVQRDLYVSCLFRSELLEHDVPRMLKSSTVACRNLPWPGRTKWNLVIFSFPRLRQYRQHGELDCMERRLYRWELFLKGKFEHDTTTLFKKIGIVWVHIWQKKYQYSTLHMRTTTLLTTGQFLVTWSLLYFADIFFLVFGSSLFHQACSISKKFNFHKLLN